LVAILGPSRTEEFTTTLGELAMELETAREIVRAAAPPGWVVGRPMVFANHRWAVWANGPTASEEGEMLV
jgi:hypothetical protein